MTPTRRATPPGERTRTFEEREEAIRVFHLTTQEILRDLFFEPDISLNAVRKVTGRLVRERKIRPCALHGNRKYFVLTPGQAARMGEDRSIGTPFQYQGLVNAYGVLLFCVENGFLPYSRKEFEEKYPKLVIRGVRAGNYYLDFDSNSPAPEYRLGFILVDYATTPRTIVRKVKKFVGRAYTNGEFAETIQSGQLVIAIVTPSAAKGQDIKAVFENETLMHVLLRIEVCECLADLLADKHLRSPMPKEPEAELPDDEEEKVDDEEGRPHAS